MLPRLCCSIRLPVPRGAPFACGPATPPAWRHQCTARPQQYHPVSPAGSPAWQEGPRKKEDSRGCRMGNAEDISGRHSTGRTRLYATVFPASKAAGRGGCPPGTKVGLVVVPPLRQRPQQQPAHLQAGTGWGHGSAQVWPLCRCQYVLQSRAPMFRSPCRLSPTHLRRAAAHLPCLAEVTRAAARVVAPWFGIGIACHLAVVPPQLIQIVIPARPWLLSVRIMQCKIHIRPLLADRIAAWQVLLAYQCGAKPRASPMKRPNTAGALRCRRAH